MLLNIIIIIVLKKCYGKIIMMDTAINFLEQNMVVIGKTYSSLEDIENVLYHPWLADNHTLQ